MKTILVLCVVSLMVSCPALPQTTSGRSNRLSLDRPAGEQPKQKVDQPPDDEAAPAAAPADRRVGGKAGNSFSSRKLPSLSVRLGFREPGNNILDAEETGTINVQVKNDGSGVASKLKLRITPVNQVPGITLGIIPDIGDLSAGVTRSIDVPVTASSTITTAQARFRVEVLEKKGFDLDPPAVITFQTREFSPPRLIIADYMTEGQGGTNVIKPRELVEITARVQNRGKSVAKSTTVDISAGENIFFEEGAKTHQVLGDVKPGEYRDVKISCYANNRAKDMPLYFNLKEARTKYDTTGSLTLALNKPQRRAMEFITEAKEMGSTTIEDAPSLAVDVDVNLPSTGMSNPDAIAIVIGNPDYEKTKRVDFALRDATSIRRYLVDMCGYRDENVIFITNASKSDFELYFGTREDSQGKLFNMIKPGSSDVFVYYSGHGAPGMRDHKGYFVPVECDPNYVELQGYPTETFYNNLSKINAKSVNVVIDACFSGADLVKNVSPLLLKLESGSFPLANGVALSSSKSDQVSSWYNEKQHGLFTYFFLKGMHDRAADLNKDGQITMDEMYKYLSDKSNGVPYFARRINGVEQTPTLQGDAKGKVLVKY